MVSNNKRATPERASVRGKGARILYVDDEEAQLYLGKRLLVGLGYRATVFNDPLRALQAFRQQPTGFDLAITDFSMPQLSGLDFVRELKALRAGLPVVMTSGYMRADEEDAARRLGVGELIPKPLPKEQLRRALERLLAGDAEGEPRDA